jgi:predicted DNA-binding transcriptional regulator YafY
LSRVQRLLGLLELLRQHPRPVRGEEWAARLNISLGTLYRDIAEMPRGGR